MSLASELRAESHVIDAEIERATLAPRRTSRDGPRRILFCGQWCPPLSVRRVSQFAPWEPAQHREVPWLTICRGCLVIVARSTDQATAISAADLHWCEKHEGGES